MNRLAWILRQRARAIAFWTGALLIAVALVLHAVGVRPLEQMIEALQARQKSARDGQLDRLGEELARRDSPRAQLAGFYRHFANDDPLTDRLARVHAIASSLGLELKRADYRLNSQPERRLDRYQMIVPIQGSYPKVRAFVTTVLRELPTMSLEQLQFQRKDVGEGDVETQISFTFYLAKP